MQFLDNLSEELSENQPFQWMIKGCINNVTKPFVRVSNRDELFQKLIDADLSKVAHETTRRMMDELPTQIDDINVYIFPSIKSGGGACFAPGNIISTIPCDELAPLYLKRNIAHEYSHTIRMIQKPQETAHGFGESVPYSMRDYLAFEGLAMVLSESLYPHEALTPYEVSFEDETKFWEATDLDVVGMSAYVKYMTMRAYEISSRIVKSYLHVNKVSIIEAHSKTDEEIYWKSDYPHIR